MEKTSLRQMSRYLHRDLVPIARVIHPYIKQGRVQILSAPNSSSGGRSPRGYGITPSHSPDSQDCLH